jgi:hypothetical protein
MSMDPYTAMHLADATQAERLRDAERDRRARHASDYDQAAASLPPRAARGDWRTLLSRIIARRLQADPRP